MLRCMRTTLTLDDDIAALIERLRQEKNMTLRDLVNESMRLGIRQMMSPPAKSKAFKTKRVSLGKCKIASLDGISEVLSLTEEESYK